MLLRDTRSLYKLGFALVVALCVLSLQALGIVHKTSHTRSSVSIFSIALVSGEHTQHINSHQSNEKVKELICDLLDLSSVVGFAFNIAVFQNPNKANSEVATFHTLAHVSKPKRLLFIARAPPSENLSHTAAS